jgi:acylphosphatase
MSAAQERSVIARRLLIRGRVQGVGYRYSLVDAAETRGVRGWVRNRRDGSVEAFVQGAESDVEAIVAWCRRGPPAAQVSAVDVEPASPDAALADFTDRPTI